MSFAKHAILLSVIGFLAVGSFGLGSAGIVMHNTDGKMSGCPLVGVPAVCHMSPLDHAFALQGMLTTAVPFGGLFALIVSLLLAFSFIPLIPFMRKSLELFSGPSRRSSSVRDKILFRHTLQEAFARGILNSKAF